MAFEHQPHSGSLYLNAMPRVVCGGLVPASTRWQMERRLDAVGRADELELWGKALDTGDGIVVSANGSVKIRRSSPAIRAVRGSLELVDSGISHDDAAYAAIDAEEIPAYVVEQKFNRHLKPGEAEHHEGLLALVGGDARLLRAYDSALRSLRARNQYDPLLANGIFIHSVSRGAHIERPVGLDCLGFDCIPHSRRGGTYASRLDAYANLAAIAPEALERRLERR